MYPSRITGYQYLLSLKVFFSHPSVSLSSFINLVAKVKIFIKLITYVLSHGCLLNSYKAFFHLHTWLCMSCDFTSSGYKCLFVVYAFFSWDASCYESCFVFHDDFIYCMMELRTSLHVSILHPRHHSSWTDLPFLLGIFCTNDVTAFVILFFIFELSSLILWNKSHYSLLVGDYVRDLSYKSNAFVWLETFHKEYSYWQVLMHKYMIMQLL